jgi:hypothetical protein
VADQSSGMFSTLGGVMETLEAGQPLASVQIEELDRLFTLLSEQGWSGLIPADQALAAIVAANARYERALREVIKLVAQPPGSAVFYENLARVGVIASAALEGED